MKKFALYFSSLVLLASTFTGCIKQDDKTFKGLVAEFDAAVLNSPAVGKTFPILTRVPIYGVAVSTANPLITRTSGTIKFRVNLVGAQSSSARTIPVSVVAGETTAVDGTHYTISNTITIPANSSFGELTVNVINPGTSSTTPRIVVFELGDGSEIKASANYKRLGISIAQN